MVYHAGTGMDWNLDSDYEILVSLLILLGFKLGLICKMGIFMSTLLSCSRNKSERTCGKQLAER